MFSPSAVTSEEATLVIISGMALIGLAIPLGVVCYHHIIAERLLLGGLSGGLGILVAGIAAWKMIEAVQRARRVENRPHS